MNRTTRTIFYAVLIWYLFSGCGWPPGENPESVVEYTPIHEAEYIKILEEYYGQELDLVMEWYYTPSVEDISIVCKNDNAAACAYVVRNSTVFLREEFKDICRVELHELMHKVMQQLYGNPDVFHVRDEWEDVWDLCNDNGLPL